jgi:MoaA/NifB/PqqE/SkfB family radical SAM enzyme
MYSLDSIRVVHFEVTSKCQARCPMCPRRMQGGPMMPWVTLEEITIEQFKEWFPISFIQQLDRLFMCGNLGDPIIAKDTVPIFKYLREHNPNINLQMHTNGSARDAKFWQGLAETNVVVVFGLDGLEDTHSKYRINTDFNRIIENAKTFINAGGEARWDMLVFDHNKHQTNECEELAYSLGFSKFQKKDSSRFKDGKYVVLDDTGTPIDILYPTNRSIEFIEKTETSIKEETPVITCKAKNRSELYIGANGAVTPCCWIDVEWVPPVNPERQDYMTKLGYFPNLNKQSLTEIFESQYFNEIENSWGTSCLTTCKKQCGSFDKLGAQFES